MAKRNNSVAGLSGAGKSSVYVRYQYRPRLADHADPPDTGPEVVCRLQSAPIIAFGKQPWEVEIMLRLNRSDEKPGRAIDIDANQPLNRVVEELLRLAN